MPRAVRWPCPAGGETQTPDGALQFGRASYVAGTYEQYWRGRVDEVAVFQQAAAARRRRQGGQAAGQSRDRDGHRTRRGLEPRTERAAPSLADAVSGYGRSLALSGGASLDGAAIVLDGTNDAATVTGPVVDDTGSFTVTTEVELDQAALNAKGTGYIGQVLGQRTADGSAWGLWYEQTGTETRFDDDDNPYEVPVGFWRFGRLAADADGTFTVTAETPTRQRWSAAGCG